MREPVWVLREVVSMLHEQSLAPQRQLDPATTTVRNRHSVGGGF